MGSADRLTSRRVETRGQRDLYQVGPCKSDLLKEYASDLKLSRIYECSGRIRSSTNTVILLKPLAHNDSASSRRGAVPSPQPLSPIEQIDCKQLSIVSPPRLTYLAADNEARNLSVQFGNVYLDFAGKPVSSQHNALGLVQSDKIVVRDDSCVCRNPALYIHVRTRILLLCQPDQNHTFKLSFG